MNITEEPIPDELMGNIRACANDALRVLGGDAAKADPATIVNAIDEFAYQWQKGKRPSTDVVEDGEEARLILGSLWGEQLVKQFGWQWAKLIFHDENDSWAIGVFSPDRSLAIYPLDYMNVCINKQDVDITVMLSFNMLLENTIPKMEPKSYTNVMAGLAHIIPRE